MSKKEGHKEDYFLLKMERHDGALISYECRSENNFPRDYLVEKGMQNF